MTRADRSRLPEVHGDPPFTFPFIVKRRLTDGLGLWCIEEPALPLVSLLLVVPAGSASDPDRLPGLASLTGDMLDEGSGSRSAIEIHDAFARIGAHLEIEVAADTTLIGLTVLSRYLGQGLSLFADCVVRPNLRKEDIERVRQLRLNRLVQLRDLAPAVADRAFMQMLYEGHPYGHLAIGTETALKEMTVDDVTAFHRGAYLASSATLIAVGDVRAEALGQMVETAFSGWTRREQEGPNVQFDRALTEPPVVSERRLAVVHRAAAAQSELRIGHVGAARSTPDYVPLLVLNMVLGGQFVSRVNLKLREEKGFTYGARTSFDFRRGRGPFLLQTSVQTQVTADAVRDSFTELQEVLADRPVTAAELDLAKSALTRGYARNFETTEQLARALAQLIVHGLPDQYYDQFPAHVREVDTAGVARVTRTHLHPDRMLTLIVGDRPALESSLASIGLGDPAVLVPA
ncbi:MAG: M16 family metallopeptidase [Vicinamibacterales bacterium]